MARALRSGSGYAIGVLLFILWDVAALAMEPLETSLTAAPDGSGEWPDFAELTAIAAVGVVVGLMGLIGYQDWVLRRGAGQRHGPGAASAGELDGRRTA